MIAPDTALDEPVAALYDVHGNLPALEAALAAADALGARSIVVGGDVVLGPMPRETLGRLRALGDRAHFIRGNCDRLVVDAFDSRPLAGLPSAVQEALAWTAGELRRADRDFLAGLPATLTAAVPGVGDILFCHATPRSDEEIVTARTSPERMRPMFAGVAQRLVVSGHTHVQADWWIDGLRVVNAGSVGMPYGRPGADWLLLGPGIQLMHTEYDVERAAALVRQTAYPGAAEFASRHVLHPALEEEALQMYEPHLRGPNSGGTS